jgi:hypothetical protein
MLNEFVHDKDPFMKITWGLFSDACHTIHFIQKDIYIDNQVFMN